MPSSETEKAAGPFSGLLVIDLTHVPNGPIGRTILSDLGARIVMVEPHGHGDDPRTYGSFDENQSLYFSFVNRGLESIALSRKDESDKPIFLTLARHADVLAENFRPGTMKEV